MGNYNVCIACGQAMCGLIGDILGMDQASPNVDVVWAARWWAEAPQFAETWAVTCVDLQWQLQAITKQFLMFLMMLACSIGAKNVRNEPRH